MFLNVISSVLTVDTIHSKGSRFVWDGKIKATVDLELNNSSVG